MRAENPSEAAIRDWCVEYLARTLDLPDHTIDPEITFARLGLDSANSVFLIVELEDWLGLPAKAALGGSFDKLPLFRA